MAKQPTCGHPDRKVFSNGKCKSCASVVYNQRRQERVRLQRKEKPPARVNPVSDLQALLNKAYNILSAELKPLHLKCEGGLAGCTHRATEIHHKKGRRGVLLILSKYFAYLCKNCHDFCTKHSKEAKEIGLSLPINSKTAYEFTERELELIEKFGIRVPKMSG